MILKDSAKKSVSNRFSLEEQARALKLVLQDEFGVAFSFFDASSGEPAPGSSANSFSSTDVHEIVMDGRARAVPSEDRYRVALLLHEGGKPVLVAAGEIAAVAGTVDAAVEERLRLQKWAQAVSDRLRMADQLISRRRQDEDAATQAQSAWEVTLTAAHLTRGLRIHKDPAKNRQRIMENAQALLGIQTLLWVPQALDAPVVIQGEAILSSSDCRQLIAHVAQRGEMSSSEPLLLNDFQQSSGGLRFASIVNLMAFQLTDQGPLGWVVALNRRRAAPRENGRPGPDRFTSTSAPFRRSDAAMLTPFVALMELHARASRRYQDLKDLLVGLTRSLTAALDAKDSYTYGHSERVARIAVELGREMGLDGDELANIYLAGLLHDVGKIGIRDAVLGKTEPLTPDEFEHIKRHVTIGYSILSDLRQIRNLLPGVLYHHERWDGTGYPEGLAGEAIPLLARILAVADAYDAMSTTRPYRDAIPCRRVEDILTQGAGSQWDQRIVEAFARCRQKIHTIRQRGVGESLQQAIDGALRIDKSLSDWKSDPMLRIQ